MRENSFKCRMGDSFMDILGDLSDILERVVKELDEFDSNREKIIHLTRDLNRFSGRAISRLVKGGDATEFLMKARELYGKLKPLMDHTAAVLSWNVSISGVEEFVELEILHAIMSGEKVPDYNELNVPSWIWVTGLADVVGELRRVVLHYLLSGDVKGGRRYLDYMGEIYENIIGLDFGKQIANSLRKKVDTARYLLERTESDMLMAALGRKISEGNAGNKE